MLPESDPHLQAAVWLDGNQGNNFVVVVAAAVQEYLQNHTLFEGEHLAVHLEYIIVQQN